MDSALDPDLNLVELLNNFDKEEVLNPLQIMKIKNKYHDIDTMSGEIDTLKNTNLK